MTFTPAQLEQRRSFLGASECSAALGMSTFFTPLELYQSKKGAGQPIEATIPMMVGTALEPVCLALLEKEDKVTVELRQQVFVDAKAPWRRCTIDGYIGHDTLVEAKTSGDFRGWGDGEDEIPMAYLFNLAHSFICIPEAKKAVLPVLIGGRTYRKYTVQRDEKLIDLVRKGEQQFRDKFWVPGVPPPPSTPDDLKLLYPKDLGSTKIATASQALMVSDLKALKGQEKTLKSKIETAEMLVKDLIGDAATLVGVDGTVLATWKTQSREEFVTKASSFRVLRVK